MASFSDSLKAATSSALSRAANESGVTNHGISTASVEQEENIDLMVLAEDELIAAYSGDDFERVNNPSYLWIEDYEDTNYSYVDALKKVSINEEQINLTQEENSQVIPFELARYYDGIDLSEMTFQIYYINAEGNEWFATPINVQRSTDRIRFYWLVDGLATAIAGNIQFEIRAEGSVKYTDNDGKKSAKSYKWKTKPCKDINILESLTGNGTIEPSVGWDTYLQQVSSLVSDASDSAKTAQQAVIDVQKAVEEVDTKINNVSTTISENIKAEMAETYYTQKQTDTLLSGRLGTLHNNDAEDITVEEYVAQEIEKADISDKLTDYVTNNVFNNRIGNTGLDEDGETPISVVKYVDDAIASIDVSDQLGDLGRNEDGTDKTVVQFVNDAVESVDISDKLGKLTDRITGEDITVEAYVKQEVDAVDISEYLKDYAKSDDVYTKDQTYSIDEINNKLENISLEGYATEEYVGSQLSPINTAITSINQTLEGIDKSPNAYYTTTYNEPYTLEGTEYTGENALVLYEIYNKDTENESRSVVSAHIITGGSGGGSSSNTIKIERVTNSPLVVTADDKVIIEYNFIGTDASGDDIGQGNVTWKLGSQVIKTETVYTGINSVDLTEYMNVGSDQKVTLIITDDIGTMQQKTWYVSVVDVKLVSEFDDRKKYTVNTPVSFTYTPYGAVDKTVHILLDGKEIDTVTSTKAAAGLSASYVVPAKEHGTHLLEVYMTATINGNDIESNHITKDIIWYDESSTVPVIGCVKQEFTSRQYEATNIEYTVYDPSTETPNVTLRATYVNEDGETIETYNSTLTLTSNTDVWAFKTDVIGTHTLTITCGETVKTLVATIVELGIEVSPTTAGLEFDFNPVGYSNNDANRIWSDSNTGVNMTVSDNFDWTNGGYQIDDVGDQYFCVKAGTTATINYNLFADDAKANGKEFKVIFKTSNVKNRNTSFISCMNNNIGLDMKVESANVYSSNGSLYSPYCEEDIIEFEFNINKMDDIPLVLTYEDGVGNRPMIYTSDSSFWQTNTQPILIGSENCDVHIYRMKAYSTSLSDRDILNNYIADARSAEEMIRRYERNQIYKEGVLDPEYLAKVCPDVRVILIDAPWFTNDKDNKVKDTNITMIYKNGDPILDNWTCTGATHRGQGTSSNEYGYAGRNIDLVMDTDTSLFTLGDGKTTSSTITLTRDSVPTDYLNVKVNIASSENQNNAQHARRYNQYNPFVRCAKFNDSRVKDCMEFYNCVVFVRERDEDISTHREFQDTNYHFYAIGNVGDSKKTDDTRVNNKRDPLECIIEITDYNVPLAEFPTGADGICSISEWKAGNTAYDFLYAEYEYEDGEFKSFGKESYEFRYEMKGITEEQRQVNIDTWREMYKFVVTSTDEEFYARLKEWFVIDSALYYYLYTERYTMVDNRAKNSFWHYGKVYITEAEAASLGEAAGGYIIDNEQAAISNGYRYDLSQGYDFDTSLGIDNTGKLVLTYGKEDMDYYVDGDSTSGYIYRAAESTFFCRLRDLFASEMQAMFVDRENANAWSASGLIKQWDDYQSQFPEELWRLDIQRKYLRTYLGISVDNSKPGAANPRFLTEMMNGRKKYQRRMFERNQELYMATKYFGKVATQDQIMMRFNNPVGAAIAPDFTLYITPYSDMYIGTSFGNVTPTNFRAKAGVEYTIPCSIESGTADITLIYGASFIQAIGDLSKCYVGDNDFSKATRLQSLVIGSDVDGYANTFMTKIALGNNKLLEYLDIQNITGLNSVVDLSQCGNLLALHAEGSGATGVIFANGGKLQNAYIPAVTSLTMKNLNYLEEFIVESYDRLQTLIVEYTPFIDTHEIVNVSPILNALRLSGMDWSIENTTILDRISLMRGISNTGGEINTSVLIGKVYVPGIKQYDYYKYKEIWSDLDIIYGSMTPQFVVTFVNDDGTVLDIQYIDQYSDAVDPITSGRIDTPTKESTVSTNYTFARWDRTFTSVGNNLTVTAVYNETVRQYSVKYVQTFGNKTEVLQEENVNYGTYSFFNGNTPTYTAEEQYSKFYLFNRWDKSGYVNGDKVINAVYDECHISDDTYFKEAELTKLSAVEIYALTRLVEDGRISIRTDSTFDYIDGTNISEGDSYSFNMGHDYNYDDLADRTHVLVDINNPKVFTGVSGDYYDTGITMLDIDRDFVIAVDYEFATGNTSGATLMECYEQNTSRGFKLSYTSNPTITWRNKSESLATGTNREMLVLRHVAGESLLHVYTSNLSGDSTGYISLTSDVVNTTTFSLIFGCGKRTSTVYGNYAKGTVHWAKLWYADLGEQACRNLASYIHEDVSLKIAGFNRYYLQNGSQLSTIDFIADKALYTKKAIGTADINGWTSTTLRSWLNNRFYSGLPEQIKQLIKKVQVKSRSGENYDSISSSYDYIYIPAVTELIRSYNYAPYSNESDAEVKYILHMESAASRTMYDYTGTAVNYWTRTPHIAPSGSRYYNYINTSGNIQQVGSTSSLYGIVVEFSI